MIQSPQEGNITRRSLLDWIIYFCSTVFGAAIAFPALAYLWPITKSGPVKVSEEVGDAAKWDAVEIAPGLSLNPVPRCST